MASLFSRVNEHYMELVNLIIRPPRDNYDESELGPSTFFLENRLCQRGDIELMNRKNQLLRCSHYLPCFPSREPCPCVIYLHGNCSSRVEALSVLPVLLPHGISVFAFDFAGSGASDGDYVSLGWWEREDLDVVITHLRATGSVSAIGLWGRSMGAVTALMHAHRDPSIGGMVLDSPFASLRRLAEELTDTVINWRIPKFLVLYLLGLVRSSIISKANFDINDISPINHVGESYIPALFVVAEGDRFINPSHGRDLYETYAGDKNFVCVDGDHNSFRPIFLLDSAAIFFMNTLGVTARLGMDSIDLRLGLNELTCEGDTCIHGSESDSSFSFETGRILGGISEGDSCLSESNRTTETEGVFTRKNNLECLVRCSNCIGDTDTNNFTCSNHKHEGELLGNAWSPEIMEEEAVANEDAFKMNLFAKGNGAPYSSGIIKFRPSSDRGFVCVNSSETLHKRSEYSGTEAQEGTTHVDELLNSSLTCHDNCGPSRMSYNEIEYSVEEKNNILEREAMVGSVSSEASLAGKHSFSKKKRFFSLGSTKWFHWAAGCSRWSSSSAATVDICGLKGKNSASSSLSTHQCRLQRMLVSEGKSQLAQSANSPIMAESSTLERAPEWIERSDRKHQESDVSSPVFSAALSSGDNLRRKEEFDETSEGRVIGCTVSTPSSSTQNKDYIECNVGSGEFAADSPIYSTIQSVSETEFKRIEMDGAVDEFLCRMRVRQEDGETYICESSCSLEQEVSNNLAGIQYNFGLGKPSIKINEFNPAVVGVGFVAPKCLLETDYANKDHPTGCLRMGGRELNSMHMGNIAEVPVDEVILERAISMSLEDILKDAQAMSQ